MSHQLPIAERIRCSTRVQALLKQSHTVIRSRWMDEQLSGYKKCLDEYPQLYWKVLFYLFRPDLERQIEPQVTESALLYFMVEFGWVPILYHTGIKEKDQLNARLEHYWQCYNDDVASNQPVSHEELGDVPREFPYRFAQTLNFPFQFYNLSHVSLLGWFTRSSINTTSLAMARNLVSLFGHFRECAQKGEDILTTNYVVHVRFAYILSVSTLFRIAAQNVEQQCEELQETVSENRVEMIVYFSDSDNGPKIRKYLNKEMFRYFVHDKTFRELCQKSLFPQKEKVKEEKKEAALPNEEEIVIMPEKYCDWLFGERKVYDCVEWGKPFVTVKVFNRLCSKYDKKKVNSPPQLGPDDDPFDPEETVYQAEPVEEQAVPVDKKSDLVEWMPDDYEKYLRSIAILPSRANWTCTQLMVMFNDSMREFVLNEVTKELHSARTILRDQIIWLAVVGRRAHKQAQDYLKNPSADDDEDSDSSEDSDSDRNDEAVSDDDSTQAQGNLGNSQFAQISNKQKIKVNQNALQNYQNRDSYTSENSDSDIDYQANDYDSIQAHGNLDNSQKQFDANSTSKCGVIVKSAEGKQHQPRQVSRPQFYPQPRKNYYHGQPHGYSKSSPHVIRNPYSHSGNFKEVNVIKSKFLAQPKTVVTPQSESWTNVADGKMGKGWGKIPKMIESFTPVNYDDNVKSKQFFSKRIKSIRPLCDTRALEKISEDKASKSHQASSGVKFGDKSKMIKAAELLITRLNLLKLELGDAIKSKNHEKYLDLHINKMACSMNNLCSASSNTNIDQCMFALKMEMSSSTLVHGILTAFLQIEVLENVYVSKMASHCSASDKSLLEVQHQRVILFSTEVESSLQKFSEGKCKHELLSKSYNKLEKSLQLYKSIIVSL